MAVRHGLSLWELKLYTPEDSIHDDVYLEAVRQNGEELSKVPKKSQTLEICRTAISNNSNAFYYTPCHILKKIFEDKDWVKQNAQKWLSKNGYILQFFPKEFRTKEVCHIAVRNNSASISYVPVENINMELCFDAVYLSDEDFKSSSFDNASLYHIPEEFHTEALYREAFRYNPHFYYKIPINVYNDKLKMLIDITPLSIRATLPFLLTEDICRLALEKDANILKYIPDIIHQNPFFENYQEIPMQYNFEEIEELLAKRNEIEIFQEDLIEETKKIS